MNIISFLSKASGTEKIKKGEQKKMEQKPRNNGLQEDKFEKSKPVVEKEEKRDAPNFAITKSDLAGLSTNKRTVVYSEEDQKKLDSMNDDERLEYKKYLLKNHKYKLVDNE